MIRGSQKAAGGRAPLTKLERRQASLKFLEHTDKAIKVVLEILENNQADNGHRLAAAKLLFDRGLGQAPTHQTLSIEDSRDEKPMISKEALMALSQDELDQWARLARKIVHAEDATIEATALPTIRLENDS
jgi:hypothetical protein